MYCYYTAAYQDLVDRWLRPSVARDYQLVEHRDPESTVIAPKSPGWVSITRRKFAFILEDVRGNWSQPFVYSDPDAQLLGPTRLRLLHLVRGRDLLFQKDSSRPDALCTGFFICRGNSKTLKFWSTVRDQMAEADDQYDQDYANVCSIGKAARRNHRLALSRLIATRLSQHRANPLALRWGYLPVQFFGGRHLRPPCGGQGCH